MLRGIDASSEKFLTDLSRIQSRLERAERQISSGLRVTRPSDAPDQVGSILQSRSDLDRTTQIRTNLERVKSEVDTGDQAVQSAISLLERAATLGAQGISSLVTAATRKSLSIETESVLGQLVAVSNTTFDGRNIFSGDADRTQPYTVDLTRPNGVSQYAGAAATRQLQHPGGTTFPVSRNAQELFENDSEGNVFAALNNLRVALAANDQPGIQTSSAAVRQAAQALNGQASFYGSAQNQIAEGINYASQQELRQREALSNLQDTDLAEATLELTQGRYQQEAALSARARLPRTSLFDFLG